LGLVNFFFLNFRYGPPPLCPNERRFSAWCASLILVLILEFEVQQYSEQSIVICVWAITGSVQVAVSVILEVLPPTTTAEAFRSSPLSV
jgi:FtsH-binding integral membrane protein